MPSMKFFRCNVRHATVLVIFFSFSPLNRLNFPFYLFTFRDHSTLDKICDGLGITLSQFFSEDMGKLELSSEQKRVLETWESLSDKEKAAVEIYVRGMKLK